MKIWMRYLLGTGTGVLVGVAVPLSGGDTYILLQELSAIVFRVGRFLLFPMVFFAAIVAMDELRDDRTAVKTLITTAVALGVALFFAVIIGALSVLVMQPQRIPPMVQEGRAGTPPEILSILTEVIPGNAFRLFVAGDNMLLMIVLFGMIVGATLRYDREITSPISLVADSANRILYRLNAGLVQVIGFALIIPAAMVVAGTRQTDDLMLFGQLLLVVVTATLLVGTVAYPLALYLLDRERARPLAWLYRMTPPAVAALVSGDVFFAAATYSRVSNENQGIPRPVGGVVPPLMAVFGRAGTALVSVAAFLLVIRSYTALEIGVAAVVELSVTGILYSFLLGRHPAGGVMILLSYLSLRYGRGMEESYLILLPVMPLLERIGAWLDIMTVGFVAQVVAQTGRYVRTVDRTV
ncbi:MAG TPA: cation:dicarboxylase symporter family transporter [Alkalispirochaeta sp.]|nr:cation:dicarboxylase symporter family transporter [Alkalispirochaeta sp.]